MVAGDLLSLRIWWQVDPHARRRRGANPRSLPKGQKIRDIDVPSVTVTGYDLRAALLQRRDAARAEHTAGTNPDAQLFPAARGGLQHHTRFTADVFTPAARAAGWREQTWTEVRDEFNKPVGRYVTVTRERRQFVHPWHSLRHRFARFCIDTLDTLQVA